MIRKMDIPEDVFFGSVRSILADRDFQKATHCVANQTGRFEKRHENNALSFSPKEETIRTA